MSLKDALTKAYAEKGKEVPVQCEPDKKRVSIKDELKPNGSVSCKCGEKMEFYGVDGTGGLMFSCPKCYEKRNIKSDNR
jgi:hypothetical protein